MNLATTTAAACGSTAAPHKGYNAVDARRYCVYCGEQLRLRPQDLASMVPSELTDAGRARLAGLIATAAEAA